MAAEVPDAAGGDTTGYESARDGRPHSQMQSSTSDSSQDEHPHGGVWAFIWSVKATTANGEGFQHNL